MLAAVRSSTRGIACLALTVAITCVSCKGEPGKGEPRPQPGGASQAASAARAVRSARQAPLAAHRARKPEQTQLAYWLARYSSAELDEPILTLDDVQAL